MLAKLLRVPSETWLGNKFSLVGTGNKAGEPLCSYLTESVKNIEPAKSETFAEHSSFYRLRRAVVFASVIGNGLIGVWQRQP